MGGTTVKFYAATIITTIALIPNDNNKQNNVAFCQKTA